MADFSPPTSPPPPKVPEGWKAIWNDQYKEWFYVNIYTKKSQWDKPTEPIYPPSDATPDGPPPYDRNNARTTGPEKGDSNNPFRSGAASSQPDISDDERLARQLQEEENQRAGIGSSTDRGEADSYYNNPAGGSAYSQPNQPSVSPGPGGELPPRPDDSRGMKGKGLFGKLFGSKQRPQQQYYQQQPQGQYYPPQGYPPQQGYGPGYGPGYGGYPPQGGYYPPQQPPPRKQGLGTGGAAALGLGGGLLGGMLLGEALDHGGDGGYGGDDGGFGGGDGGDFGGGGF